MLKRMLAMCLTACLSVGMVQASAAELTQNQQLEAVTKLVKAQLELGDGYESFSGEKRDAELRTSWTLNWRGASGNVSVEALDDGTIVWYNMDVHENDTPYSGGFSPSFPKVSREQAKSAAAVFLKKVLRPRETVVFDESNYAVPRSQNAAYYNFYGMIYYDALSTPEQVSIQIATKNLAVTNYSRNAELRIGAIPSKNPVTPQTNAADLLKGTHELRLEYTTESSTQSDGEQATLKYVPRTIHNFYVDAQTGKLVDLTDLREKLSQNEAPSARDSGANTASGGAAKESLSAVEQAGAALLKDVLDKEELDRKVRAMQELGLVGYTLSSAEYAVDQKSGDVTANLRYIQSTDAKERSYKYATLDAKTGALLSLFSSYSAEGAGAPDESAAGKEKAEAFLKKYQPEAFSKCMAYDSERAGEQFYARQENGHPFPENYLSVTVNQKTGAIDQFGKAWSDKVRFAAADNLITAEKAMEAYFDAHEVTLGYIAVPVKLDISEPRYAAYIERGYTYLNEWKLGYTAALSDFSIGVDAKSGEVLFRKGLQKENQISYSDATAQGNPEAMKLAEYGVGYSGGKLLGEQALLQKDLIALLMSADGYQFDILAEEAYKELYEAAYRRGILTLPREEWAAESTVSRAELARIVVSSTGYGKAADLSGIYRCSFTDEKSIPQKYYGYVAIAQGMGLIHGDEQGRFQPSLPATREQAAVVLFHLMSR